MLISEQIRPLGMKDFAHLRRRFRFPYKAGADGVRVPMQEPRMATTWAGYRSQSRKSYIRLSAWAFAVQKRSLPSQPDLFILRLMLRLAR
jgi:hypothetical protein